MSDHQVGEEQGGRVAGEDVVTAQHVFPVDGETAAREDGQDSLHNDEPGDVLHPGPALVPHVGLGEDRDGHGEGPVVVDDPQDQPDSPEYDESVGLTQHHAQGQHQVQHQQDLTDVQSELLVGDVVQDQVGEGGGVGGDPVVRQGQTEGGGQEPAEQEQPTEQGFNWLLWQLLLLLLLLDINHSELCTQGVGRPITLSRQSHHITDCHHSGYFYIDFIW